MNKERLLYVKDLIHTFIMINKSLSRIIMGIMTNEVIDKYKWSNEMMKRKAALLK